jgi:predicted tellurium resistance membrane protein TerC
MTELLLDPQNWVSFLTLTVLEVVLGIDNIIFLSILVSRLPAERQPTARTVGLGLAMVTRIALLFSITWLITLTRPLFAVADNHLSGRDLILIAGGLFLLAKSVSEIHGALEGAQEQHRARPAAAFLGVVIQIAIIDIVFSLDSVFTAVGLAQHVEIMVAAIVLSVAVMMFMAGPINEFIERHPTIKILALAFLILVGVALVAEGFEVHIPRGYLYFAMAFSIGVEMVNIRIRRRAEPVQLHTPSKPEEGVRPAD